MKFLYTLLFYLALPIIFLRLVWRGIRAPAYFKRWPERFGFIPKRSTQTPLIWLHAVSVGEVEASKPLVKGLQQRYPHHQLLITTMTPTGSARVKAIFGDNVLHTYLPYDLPTSTRRFLKIMQPAFGIIMETELWPNLLLACRELQIPIVIANARLSERSARGYQRFANFAQQMLRSIPLITTQTQTDKARFEQLGALPQHVHAIGNLKYEISLPASLKEQADAIKSHWRNRPVVIAASTHEGEEEIVLNAAKQIRAQFPDLLLILVPRHPERFDRAAALSRKLGFKTVRRTENTLCTTATQVLVIDTMGELPLFYACSDLAIIGGTLVPHGGHNLLEPAALGRPVISGPHYFNFTEMTRHFLTVNALIEVSDSAQLARTAAMLLADPAQRDRMGQAGQQLIQQNKGASERLLNLIARHIYHETR